MFYKWTLFECFIKLTTKRIWNHFLITTHRSTGRRGLRRCTTPGTEGCIVPSKTYYYMAAGVVPLLVSSQPTDLARIVVDNACGIAVDSGDYQGMAKSILELDRHETLLRQYGEAARATAEKDFSRKNTELFVALLDLYVHKQPGACK